MNLLEIYFLVVRVVVESSTNERCENRALSKHFLILELMTEFKIPETEPRSSRLLHKNPRYLKTYVRIPRYSYTEIRVYMSLCTLNIRSTCACKRASVYMERIFPLFFLFQATRQREKRLAPSRVCATGEAKALLLLFLWWKLENSPAKLLVTRFCYYFSPRLFFHSFILVPFHYFAKENTIPPQSERLFVIFFLDTFCTPVAFLRQFFSAQSCSSLFPTAPKDYFLNPIMKHKKKNISIYIFDFIFFHSQLSRAVLVS